MSELNVLIVGAGVAGVTCAGLLKQRGISYKIIERDSKENYNSSGYMMGLLPMGARVITQLGLTKPYFESSIEMKTYEIHKENGDLIKKFDMGFINQEYASYRSLDRIELMNVLLQSIDENEIQYATTVKSLKQKGNEVEALFSDGNQEQFHVVVIAEGIHSSTRKLLWGEDEYKYFETHWGGWVAWVENKKETAFKEYWGTGAFMGMYPADNRIGLFLGGPEDVIKKEGKNAFAKKIKDEIKPEYKDLHEAIDTLINTENPFYWNFQDVRTKNWNKGNVVLLGDAADAFLPTAGVGASMAMDSAAALVDELSRTDVDHIEYGLELYEKRQQKRVVANQDDSRKLAKIMFVKSPIISAVRDYMVRFYSITDMAKSISKTIEG